MDSLVFHYLISFKLLAYIFFFAAMIIEGDIFLFTAGFLASRGFLDLGPIFLALFGGTLFGDSLWYWGGYKLNHCVNRCVRWLLHLTGPFDSHLMQYPLRTIFLSKFIYALHHVVLGRAGVLGLQFKKFFRYDFIFTLTWIFVVGGLGYLSGASFGFIKHYLKFTEYALVFFLAVFLAVNYFVVRYRLKKRL